MTLDKGDSGTLDRGAGGAEFDSISINGSELYLQDEKPTDSEAKDVWIETSE